MHVIQRMSVGFLDTTHPHESFLHLKQPEFVHIILCSATMAFKPRCNMISHESEDHVDLVSLDNRHFITPEIRRYLTDHDLLKRSHASKVRFICKPCLTKLNADMSLSKSTLPQATTPSTADQATLDGKPKLFRSKY